MTPVQNAPPTARAWGKVPAGVPSMLRDLPIIFAGLAAFYALLSLAHYWVAPVTASPEIQLSPRALPKYAMFSLLRIVLAYAVSLIFTLIYGYVAAYNATAERFLIPLLDTFQSQHSKRWFREDTFLSLMRLRGMECNAPSGYAEAFHCRKLKL